MHRLASFLLMCMVLASGCTPSECTTFDVWNYDVVFTLPGEPVALEDLRVSTCFLPRDSAVTICAEQTRPGTLTLVDGTLDPAQVVISVSASSLSEEIAVRWRWQTPVWLQDGDRYRVHIATGTGAVLYHGELPVSYRNISQIDEEVSEVNQSCETQVVASATLR